MQSKPESHWKVNSDPDFYYFRLDVAKEFGVDGAIVIQNFAFWIRQNRESQRNFYNGRYWTFNSVKKLTEFFPFWTPKQIGRVINSLVDKGVLVVGNFNTRKGDQTNWYAFTDKWDHLTIWENGTPTISPDGKSILPNGQTISPFGQSVTRYKTTDIKNADIKSRSFSSSKTSEGEQEGTETNSRPAGEKKKTKTKEEMAADAAEFRASMEKAGWRYDENGKLLPC